jgi:predicted small secreted protein
MKDWIVMIGIKVAVIGLAVSIVLLTGCNTVSGIGKDIQTSSEWTKKQMEPGVKLDSSK